MQNQKQMIVVKNKVCTKMYSSPFLIHPINKKKLQDNLHFHEY